MQFGESDIDWQREQFLWQVENVKGYLVLKYLGQPACIISMFMEIWNLWIFNQQ
jgi:hypothetical protein